MEKTKKKKEIREIVVGKSYKKTEVISEPDLSPDAKCAYRERTIWFYREVYEVTENLVCVGFRDWDLTWMTKNQFLREFEEV